MPGSALDCVVVWRAPPATGKREHEYYEATARCGNTTQPLRLLPDEKAVELRVFADWTFVEVYFQRGRVAMTTPLALGKSAAFSLLRSGGGSGTGTGAAADVASAVVYPMKPIMTTPEAVRAAPRVLF